MKAKPKVTLNAVLHRLHKGVEVEQPVLVTTGVLVCAGLAVPARIETGFVTLHSKAPYRNTLIESRRKLHEAKLLELGALCFEGHEADIEERTDAETKALVQRVAARSREQR